MQPKNHTRRPKRIKLIFNPVSGTPRESPIQLMDVIQALQDWNFVPEPYLTEPDTDYDRVVKEAVEQGIGMIV
ncbi:MAG: hypothetical protein N2376_04640, partial [Clostridia bacterium]|nr:hypothetical protein [Clostridia bacterium]